MDDNFIEAQLKKFGITTRTPKNDTTFAFYKTLSNQLETHLGLSQTTVIDLVCDPDDEKLETLRWIIAIGGNEWLVDDNYTGIFLHEGEISKLRDYLGLLGDPRWCLNADSSTSACCIYVCIQPTHACFDSHAYGIVHLSARIGGGR